ncbi:MAG: ABC transporter ATP-binding protein [Lachnospiraceae bacterium]|nr:ABC transporter ATP-binding protein [Lachnospiraceae bacterium]
MGAAQRRPIDYTRSGLAVMAAYIAPHKKMFAADMILSVIIAFIDLAFPYVSRWTMNTLLPQNAFRTFFAVMAIIAVAYIGKAVMTTAVTKIDHGMGVKVEADMRTDIFNHMEELSFEYYDRNRTGVLLGRITNDLFDITELAHHGPENILTCTLTIAGALIIMMTVNLRLGAVLLIMTPACILFAMWARKKMQEASVDVKKVTGEINASIESSISGIRTSKAFANETIEGEKFEESNEKFKTMKRSFYHWMGIFSGGTEAMVGLMQVVVIAYGGYLIMNGQMTFVDLITFTLYVSTFTSPVRKLMQSMEVFAQGLAGFERFLEVMRTKASIEDDPDAVELTDVKGHVVYDHVSFEYADGTEVLKDVSVQILPGETFAMVGSSGGGKTTFCHLLPRFYDVKSGSISIDGIDIRKVTQSSLRRNIGIIQQDVFLFAGTVMENIRYGRPDATDEEVINAAKMAQIHDEIMQMPEKYDTFVGERGIVLSGGQKQRVSIARVFLKDPQIVILDEATSALDSVTERQIQEALYRLSVGKTTIVIAHRLSTIREADCIAVIEGKHITEKGTREELLLMDGAYAALERASAW